MGRTSFTEPACLPSPLRAQLLDVARTVIRAGCLGERLTVRPEEYPEALRAQRACFVTLYVGGELRGCIGSLEAQRALVEDVADNAYAAAFGDPRFPALRLPDVARLEVSLSILSDFEPLVFGTEAELLAQLRVHVDGLVLEEGRHRGTFLPSVWEQLPQPREFLRQLKLKAGLAGDYWSSTLMVRRYTVETVP